MGYPMFQEMRLKKRQVSQAETEAILRRGQYGVLSLNAGGDYAYGVPLSYVFQNNSIYLHCAPEGKKLTLLRQDNRVCFCVVAEAEPLPQKFSMKYQSALAFGRVKVVEAPEEKLSALIALVQKYYQDPEDIAKGREYAAASLDQTVVLRLDIAQLTGKIRK
jgi:nitroimidazol reductase NimA-like FMN-containing flavoprotein (pyridoxamine 5'-phosphate oxidase superfamily)